MKIFSVIPVLSSQPPARMARRVRRAEAEKCRPEMGIRLKFMTSSLEIQSPRLHKILWKAKVLSLIGPGRAPDHPSRRRLSEKIVSLRDSYA
jgi:hypothetical protein